MAAMKLLFRAVAVWLLLAPLQAGGETVDRIVAVVNDEVITSYQLSHELERRGAAGAEPAPADPAERRRRALDELIDETLIRQQAAALGIKVGDAELDAAIEDVLKQNRLTREQLEEALRAQGLSLEEYRETIRQQILRFKVIGREVQSRVDVTTEEIGDYYRSHPEEFPKEPTLRLSRLTFAVPAKAAPATVEMIRGRAEEALARLRRGDDFHAVLLQYAGDGSAQGGDMGTFRTGELTPAFDQAVAGLKAGEMTPVIRTPEGFHLLKVTERDATGVLPLEQVRESIEKKLLESKTEARLREWFEKLRREAFIDIRS